MNLGRFLAKSKFSKVLLAILILSLVVQLFGCSKKNNEITQEKYDKLKQKITLSNGLTVLELEELMMRFVYSVYNPKSEEDLKAGVDLIKDIVTESVYDELLDTVQFNEGVVSNISNLEVRYSNGKNHSDHLSRVLCKFTLNSGGYSQNIIIEFVMNDSGKIFKYYIWNGAIRKR